MTKEKAYMLGAALPPMREAGGAQALKLRPSPLSFARRYLLALAPVLIYTLSHWLSTLAGEGNLPVPQLTPQALAPLLTFAALLLSWVLRSSEAAASSLLSLLLPAVLALLRGAATLGGVVAEYQERYAVGALAASLLTLAAVEARRRSISYEVSSAGVRIEAGVWRRQEQTIPYGSIGRIVLEQSPFGRALNYGTVVLVSLAEWGAEYYTRGIEAGAGRAFARLFYARTLKELSRDPGKCLYGVRNPRTVKEAIEARLREVQGAELEQARLLRELRDELTGGGRGIRE